jgi:D-amino-acid oxidase
VRGKTLLYTFLEEHGIAHRRCGKLIVAARREERTVLESIRTRALRCGVDDLVLLDVHALKDLEPVVAGEAALLSPSTGIVDTHQLMLALQGEFETAGGSIALASPVLGGTLSARGKHVLRVGGSTPAEIECRLLVNASGLDARTTWLSLAGDHDASRVPPQYYAKGHYYGYSGPSPFSHLVYPLPEAAGLGVHATLDLGGQLRFGPDVRWVETIDYAFDDSEREAFARAIRAWFPALDATRLQPGYTGIRPKIAGRGEPTADFAILTAATHGIPGFCSLHGIESPGLTACLAIAEHVASALRAAPGAARGIG